MISRDELISFSRLNNLRPHQQEKHYVQALILSSISEHEMVFKGGTYLWFFHGLKRFSEDLDFTATGKTEGIEEAVSSDLEMLGVESTCRIFSDEERSFSFRISAHALEFLPNQRKLPLPENGANPVQEQAQSRYRRRECDSRKRGPVFGP